jgi:hypothetical protein
MSGWIKLHRSITEHWLYTENRKFSKYEAWNDILLTVNYAPAKTIIKGKIIYINRGESILSLESWGKKWNWEKSSVKRFLELLKKDEMIELKNETVTTRLTVCKYDTYQSKENDVETQVTRRRNASETQTKPIKEEEEKQEEKEEEIIYRNFKHLKITIQEFEKLKETYLSDDIDLVLNNIENYKNNKNYTSLYLTALNWLKKDYTTKQETFKNQYKISV